jgi:hypothetical protein
VDRDTPLSRTPTVAPTSPAHERTLLRERRARGPQKLLGPPTACVNARSEDHVIMQRPRTRGTTAAGEMKWRATLLSPRHQTAMMARRFAAERCTNASIPALRLDALTSTAPLKYGLLETSGTSPSSSSATSSSATPKPMDPSASSAAARTSSGAKRRGCPRVAGTRRRFPPGGHPAPAVPCASGRQCGAW